MTLISQLPEPYRRLARVRETQYRGEDGEPDDRLDRAFKWGVTNEGWCFWNEIYDGKYPAIPESSLKEIMTIEEIAAMPGSYTLPGFTPGSLYAFWDGDEPQEWTVARYSHSEQTTPFDRHWTADKKYFAHVGMLNVWATGRCEILAPEEGA